MPLDATFLGIISLLISQAVGDSSISENLRRLQDLCDTEHRVQPAVIAYELAILSRELECIECLYPCLRLTKGQVSERAHAGHRMELPEGLERNTGRVLLVFEQTCIESYCLL